MILFFVNNYSGEIHEMQFEAWEGGVLYASEHSLFDKVCPIYLDKGQYIYVEDLKEMIIFNGQKYEKIQCSVYIEYYIFDNIESANEFSLNLKSQKQKEYQVNKILAKARNDLSNIPQSNNCEAIKDTVRRINSMMFR